jgi:hypothetical protein
MSRWMLANVANLEWRLFRHLMVRAVHDALA